MDLEKQKKEALERLNILKKNGLIYHKPVIDTFKNGDIPIFEYQNRMFRSVFYRLYVNKEQEPYDNIIHVVKEIEREYGGLVYLVLISHTTFGTLYNLFYVSKNQKEWEEDKEDLKQKYALIYVHNASDNICSEFGSICFEYDNVCGGIYRSA